MLKGYDVAVYQPGINWPEVRAGFIIAKATEGTGLVDKLFGSHVVGALGQGIPWGGYHFAHPPQNQPEDEAAHFVRTCSTGQIVPCLDVETYGQTNPLTIMGPDRLAEWCDRWAVFVHDALGQTPLFYSFRSYASTVAPRLSGPWAGVWLATATGVPDGAYLGRNYGHLRVLIEQYGSPSGEPGFPTAVDTNVADDSLHALSGSTPVIFGENMDLTAQNLQDIANAVWAKASTNVVNGDVISVENLVRYAHGEAYGGAHMNPDAVAQAIVAKLGGTSTVGALDTAVIKQAVKDALKEGTG